MILENNMAKNNIVQLDHIFIINLIKGSVHRSQPLGWPKNWHVHEKQRIQAISASTLSIQSSRQYICKEIVTLREMKGIQAFDA